MLDIWLLFVLFLGADWIYLITFSVIRFVFHWAVELYNLLVKIFTLLHSFFITCLYMIVDWVHHHIRKVSMPISYICTLFCPLSPTSQVSNYACLYVHWTVLTIWGGCSSKESWERCCSGFLWLPTSAFYLSMPIVSPGHHPRCLNDGAMNSRASSDSNTMRHLMNLLHLDASTYVPLLANSITPAHRCRKRQENRHFVLDWNMA